jgi:exo-beta-1,3-glucanase (GH17 family)
MRIFFKDYFRPLLFALLIALIHVGLWWVVNRALPLIDAPRIVHGFAYSGYQLGQSPLEKRYPSTAELLDDLQMLKPYTDHIRTYGSLENPEVIPLASNLGMTVMAGAWLSGDNIDNEREVSALIAKIKSYPHIQRAIVGNEVLLRTDLTLEQMIRYLDRVREEVAVPVSTAEPWHVWLRNPELVKHVDFIAVHLLPYHEGIPIENALDYAM